jgi:hypothetical protein
MRVPQNSYYSFVLPANLLFIIGLQFNFNKPLQSTHKVFLENLTQYASDKGIIGLVLSSIGFLGGFFLTFISGPLNFVLYLVSMLKYVGVFYIFFSTLKFRRIALQAAFLLYLSQAIAQGMFGEFAMYSMLVLVIIGLRYRWDFFLKLSISIFVAFLVFILQSIKPAYRNVTWSGKTYEGISNKENSSYEVFGKLWYKRISNLDFIGDPKSIFPIYTRLNQGVLISAAMNYVPRVEPYANGETLLRSLSAVLVPRFLWPDKPEAGGRENIARFLGIKKRMRSSMNIGPYGEAYGNFGPFWGVVFIFFYGLLLSVIMRSLLQKMKSKPSLLLWMPLLFYYTLTVETDIFTMLNSFFKGAVFVYLMFWMAKKFFKVEL